MRRVVLRRVNSSAEGRSSVRVRPLGEALLLQQESTVLVNVVARILRVMKVCGVGVHWRLAFAYFRSLFFFF